MTAAEATRECPAALGAAVASAVRDGWTWPTELAGQAGHVSMGWSRPSAPVPDSATWPTTAETWPKRISGGFPEWPRGLSLSNPADCTLYTLIDPSGRPFFTAVDGCPAPFKQEAVRTILNWRFKAGEAPVRIYSVIVHFVPQ